MRLSTAQSVTSITHPRVVKGAATILGNCLFGASEVVVALNAGVMRRFERVVALPNPKDIEFPQPPQHFRLTVSSGPIRSIE